MADADPTIVGNDLHSSLGEPERAHLTREFHLTRRLTDSLALLRATPYPLDTETAGAVAAAAQRHVLPWPTVRDRHLVAWVGERMVADGEAGYAPRPGDDPADSFPDPSERREFERRADFTHGLTHVRDAEVEEECDALRRVIEALASEERGLAGVALPLALPLGPPSLGLVPLVEGEWVDRHTIALAEWMAALTAAGYTRLPAFDPHRLAWHRVYPPRTDWTRPVEAADGEVCELRREAAANLERFGGRTWRFDGRPHVRFADYCGWAGRRVAGDLAGRLTAGLVVTAWNAWIDRHADRDGRVHYLGEVFGRLHHPFEVESGRHFTPQSDEAAAAGVQGRAAALREWRALADEPAGRIGPEDIFSPYQLAVLQALERLEGTGVAATADRLSAEAGYDRSRLYQTHGIKELMARVPPLVVKGPKGAGYRLARGTPPAR